MSGGLARLPAPRNWPLAVRVPLLVAGLLVAVLIAGSQGVLAATNPRRPPVGSRYVQAEAVPDNPVPALPDGGSHTIIARGV